MQTVFGRVRGAEFKLDVVPSRLDQQVACYASYGKFVIATAFTTRVKTFVASVFTPQVSFAV
jgi:hypothetical protein